MFKLMQDIYEYQTEWLKYNVGDIIVTELNELAIIKTVYPDGSCKVQGHIKGNVKEIIKINGKA
jgi:hypothetical protein